MVGERSNLDYGRDDDLSGDDRPATDSSEMTEGVGGTPDVDDDERATVGDPVNDEADTYGAP